MQKKDGSELDKLPAATQTGANTMGCLVNGRAWLTGTRDNGSIPRLPEFSVYLLSSTEIDLGFNRDREGDNQRLRIYIKDFTGEGSYMLNKESDIRGFSPVYGYYNNYGLFIDYGVSKIYTTYSLVTGYVTIIKFDAFKKIISGTFQFKAKNYQTGIDSIVVTDGRFDCKIQ